MDRRLAEFARRIELAEGDDDPGDVRTVDELLYAVCGGDLTKADEFGSFPVERIILWGMMARKERQRLDHKMELMKAQGLAEAGGGI